MKCSRTFVSMVKVSTLPHCQILMRECTRFGLIVRDSLRTCLSGSHLDICSVLNASVTTMVVADRYFHTMLLSPIHVSVKHLALHYHFTKSSKEKVASSYSLQVQIKLDSGLYKVWPQQLNMSTAPGTTIPNQEPRLQLLLVCLTKLA